VKSNVWLGVIKEMSANGCCCCGGVDSREQKLNEIIEKYKNTKGALVPVLHEAEEVYGYLPLEVQKKIAEGLNIPLAEVYGVVTFYTQFSLNPKENIKSRFAWVLHVM